MPKLVRATPSYRLRKASGQAIVTLDGVDHYLGRWESKASKAQYVRLIGEWLAGGRRLPLKPKGDSISIIDLLNLYLRHARQHYVKDGYESDEVACIRSAIPHVREACSSTDAIDFGPITLRAVRQRMIEGSLSRGAVNQQIGRIRRMFRGL